jgi:starch synthase
MAPTSLNVLHIASEAVPLIKSGGLADVVGALPIALRDLGCDARVVIPGYRKAIAAAEALGLEWLDTVLTIEASGWDHRVGIGVVEVSGLPIYLLACDELYGRDGLYGPDATVAYEDNDRRYAVFTKAALALPGAIQWQPDILHAHDWQAGLVPVLWEAGYQGVLPHAKPVFSIHNMAYQGVFAPQSLRVTGLGPEYYHGRKVEHFGTVNWLKAGIVYSHGLSTVSPTYAAEIQTRAFGCGLDGEIARQAHKLRGIVNGIDTAVWNPAIDPHLPANYDRHDLSGKAVCRDALREEVGLLPMADDRKVALVGLISRTLSQKGIDLVADAVEPYILAGRMQLVILGAGDRALESRLHMLEARHPGWVTFWRGYNEGLAHRIEAGCDLFLMPSRFEPCGLNQMYSLAYGTLPLVRYTGGLADTVVDVSQPHGNGFSFGPIDIGHFSAGLNRALGLFQHYPDQWHAAQQRAMQADHSWQTCAQDYLGWYQDILGHRA